MCIPVKLAFFIRLTVWGFIQVLAYISSSFLLVTGWYVDIHPHCFQFGVSHLHFGSYFLTITPCQAPATPGPPGTKSPLSVNQLCPLCSSAHHFSFPKQALSPSFGFDPLTLYHLVETLQEDLPESLVDKTLSSQCSSIPDQGTKIPHIATKSP